MLLKKMCDFSFSGMTFLLKPAIHYECNDSMVPRDFSERTAFVLIETMIN